MIIEKNVEMLRNKYGRTANYKYRNNSLKLIQPCIKKIKTELLTIFLHNSRILFVIAETRVVHLSKPWVSRHSLGSGGMSWNILFGGMSL